MKQGLVQSYFAVLTLFSLQFCILQALVPRQQLSTFSLLRMYPAGPACPTCTPRWSIAPAKGAAPLWALPNGLAQMCYSSLCPPCPPKSSVQMNWSIDSEEGRLAHPYPDLWWHSGHDFHSHLCNGLLHWSTLCEDVQGIHVPTMIYIMTEGC